MGTMIYKNHVITTDANWDRSTERYASMIRVVWQTVEGKREIHSFTLA